MMTWLREENGHRPASEIPNDALPTKKVAQLLSLTPKKISEMRSLYSEQLIKGVDYFQNSRGHYFWLETGLDKLDKFNHQLEAQKTKKKVFGE